MELVLTGCPFPGLLKRRKILRTHHRRCRGVLRLPTAVGMLAIHYVTHARRVVLRPDRRNQLRERIVRAAEAALAHYQYVSAIDILTGAGLLAPTHVESWRKGRIDFLERVIQVNLKKNSQSMAMFCHWALANGLQPSENRYVRRTRTGTVDLQFSKSRDPAIEKSYRMYYVSPALSERKQVADYGKPEVSRAEVGLREVGTVTARNDTRPYRRGWAAIVWVLAHPRQLVVISKLSSGRLRNADHRIAVDRARPRGDWDSQSTGTHSQGKNDWKPHEKSMPLGALATIVATIPAWLDMVVNVDELDINPPGGSTYKPPQWQTSRDLLDVFEASLKKGRDVLQKTTDDHLLNTKWRMLSGGKLMMEQTRYEAVREGVLNHMAHHRGQLTVYLRLLGERVPAIYGPSADEDK